MCEKCVCVCEECVYTCVYCVVLCVLCVYEERNVCVCAYVKVCYMCIHVKSV